MLLTIFLQKKEIMIGWVGKDFFIFEIRIYSKRLENSKKKADNTVYPRDTEKESIVIFDYLFTDHCLLQKDVERLLPVLLIQISNEGPRPSSKPTGILYRNFRLWRHAHSFSQWDLFCVAATMISHRSRGLTYFDSEIGYHELRFWWKEKKYQFERVTLCCCRDSSKKIT